MLDLTVFWVTIIFCGLPQGPVDEPRDLTFVRKSGVVGGKSKPPKKNKYQIKQILALGTCGIPGSDVKTGGPANRGVVIYEHRPLAVRAETSTHQFFWNPGKPNRHRRLRIISQIDLGDLRFDLAGQWKIAVSPVIRACLLHHHHQFSRTRVDFVWSVRRNTNPTLFLFLTLLLRFPTVGWDVVVACIRVNDAPHHKLLVVGTAARFLVRVMRLCISCKKGHHPSY